MGKYKRLSLVLAAFAAVSLTPLLAYAWPWSTDMMNQPSFKPQESPLKAFPKRSVPVTGFPTAQSNRDETEELTNPVPPSPESIDTGRTLFKIYCAACHGLSGMGDAPISELLGAIDLTDQDIVGPDEMTDGWLYGTITFGSAIMPAYGVLNEESGYRGANDMNVEERWHVVNYMRHGLAKDAETAISKAEQE